MKSKPFVILLFLGTQVLTFADRIELKNGQAASTQIVDTSGCKVTIKRKDSKVEIEKKQIERIVYGTDTINYAGFICPGDTVPVKLTRYEDTPEYQLYGVFATIPRAEAQLIKSKSILYERYPLAGNYDITVMDSAAIRIKAFLAGYGTVEDVSISAIYSCFMVDSSTCFKSKYLILPYQIVTAPKVIEGPRQKPTTMDISSYSEEKKDLPTILWGEKTEMRRDAETQIHFICLDLEENHIVFDERISEAGGDFALGRSIDNFFNDNVLPNKKDSRQLYREQYEKQIRQNVEDIVDKFRRKVQKRFN